MNYLLEILKMFQSSNEKLEGALKDQVVNLQETNDKLLKENESLHEMLKKKVEELEDDFDENPAPYIEFMQL